MKLFFISLLLSLAGYSQVNDSLLFQLRNIDNDTERVNQLYQTGFDIRNADPEMAYKFALACNKEALKCNSVLHLAKSYNLLGLLFYKKADYQKALEFQTKSLELNQSIQNHYGIAINQANLGNIYSETNYPKLAEQSYLQSLQASNKSNNTLQISRCLINIGVLKHDQKQYAAAIKQFEEAMVYANTLGNQDLIAICYNNIGAIFKDQNKLDSALLYLEEGLKIKEIIDNEIELADSYINIADIYVSQKNFNQASNYISLANTICSKYDYPEALVELYQTQSQFYEAQQNFEQANVFLKKYYGLKDSLQKTEQKNNEIIFLENNIPNAQSIESSVTLSNSWLLISLVMLAVIIPLFLIRFKR
ncbi:MAG: tetratricopeptide repeat protein [Bacteroidota bacterium]